MGTSRFVSRALKAAAVAVGLALGASSAHAGLTTVNSPIYPGEMSIKTILGDIYGQSFNAVGKNLVGSTITAKRVDDFLKPSNGVLNTLGSVGSAADQIWDGKVNKATAKARYAAFDQKFGYIDGASGGSYHNLFDVTGYGTAVTSDTVSIDIDGPFRLARNGQNGVQSSRNVDNADRLDHMVTYKIEGLVDGWKYTTWMAFFEDKNSIKGGPNAQFSDRDFNDLAVELKATAVPLPSAALMGLVGLAMPAGVKLARRYRKA